PAALPGKARLSGNVRKSTVTRYRWGERQRATVQRGARGGSPSPTSKSSRGAKLVGRRRSRRAIALRWRFGLRRAIRRFRGNVLQLLSELLQLGAEGGELLARALRRVLEQHLQLGLGAITQLLKHLARLLLEFARPGRCPGLGLLE